MPRVYFFARHTRALSREDAFNIWQSGAQRAALRYVMLPRALRRLSAARVIIAHV